MLNQTKGYFSFLKKVPKTGKLAKSFLYSYGLVALLCACQSPPPKMVESPTPSASPVTKASPKTTPKPTKASPKTTPKPTKASAKTTKASAKTTPKLTKAPSPTKSTARTPARTLVTLNIFRLDNQCNQFVSQKVTLPRSGAVEKAVAQVIEEVESADLDLAGYRVNVKGSTATIDFRLPTDAKRPLSSLSTCEQLALYGSLRKTLTGNAPLKIKSVQFTDRGRRITP